MHLPWIRRVAPTLAACVIAAAEPVTVQHDRQQVLFRAGGRELVRYQAEPGPLPRPDIPDLHRRGGYLHPLRTPSGRIVTDDFPSNHLHHHGVWSAWTSTEWEGRRPDFWNLGLGRGRVDFVGMKTASAGSGAAVLTASHRFLDLTAGEPRPVLEETWEVRVSVPSGGRLRHQVDLDLIQHVTGASGLRLPEYHYGGLGFRGNWAWNGPAGGRYLVPEGVTNRVAINGTRARWFWMGGPLDGDLAGVAILGHPGNLRAPQPVRLHPEEPFFCYAPQQLGAFELLPGEPYRARYRLVVFDGAPDPAEVDTWWEQYASGR